MTHARTDTDGVATFEVVPDAQMRLEVVYNGARHDTGVVDTEITPLVTVATHALSFDLVSSSGLPLAGARVNLRRADERFVTHARTSAAGRARFEVLPGAETILEVVYHGASADTGPLHVVTDRAVELRTHALSLALTDSTGGAHANARVNLRRADGRYVTHQRTDADGVATFEVVPDAIMRLEASLHGGVRTTAPTQVQADTRLAMQTVPLTVRVTESCTALTGQRVDLRRADGRFVLYRRADAEGEARLEVLPEVSHRVSAKRDGVTWTSDAMTAPAALRHDFAGAACAQ